MNKTIANVWRCAKAIKDAGARLLLSAAVAAYAVLRFLVPTRKDLVTFISTPDFSDNALALFERMKAMPAASSFRFVWLVNRASETADVTSSNVRFIKKNTLKGLLYFLRSRFVFFTHRTYRFARTGTHQTLVNLWHGMPIKTVGAFVSRAPFLERPFSHFTIATSAYFGELMSKAFCIAPENVLITGLPRNEWLFQTDALHEGNRRDEDSLVVWLPTFREYNVDGYELHDACGEDMICASELAKLDEALEGARIKVLLKFHPGDVRNRQKWPPLRNIQIMTAKEFRGRGLNVYKLLACADALVTDFSSIAIDFLIAGKPIALFGADESCYRRGVFAPVLEKLREVSFEADTLADLAGFLRDLPKGLKNSQSSEFLHWPQLKDPSEEILKAIAFPVESSTTAFLQPITQLPGERKCETP